MKRKYLLLILLFCITLTFVSGAETINYTSITVSENTNLPNSPNGYYLNQYPIFSATFEDSSNVSLFCVDSLSDFNDCRRAGDGAGFNLTSCDYYSIANTSTTPILTNVNSQIITAGTIRIYCQICDSDGNCDNSTFSGNNYVDVYTASITRLQSTMLPVGLIAYIGILIMIGVKISKGSDKKTIRKKLETLFISGIIGAMAILLLYMAML